MKEEKKETTDEMVSLKVRTFIGLIISIITIAQFYMRNKKKKGKLFMKNEDIVITSAFRTPIGSFGGSLSKQTAPQLGAEVIKKCMRPIIKIFINLILTKCSSGYWNF